MTNEQSVFRFDLNESLYFEKGQEVAEIMGISLDPEISIQEFNDFISIRGVVELQGSYQKAQTFGDEDADETYLDGYDSRRYMERVTETQYGGAEFMHRFPVEITVPSYRVNNLDDVTVTISEFDYELPESDHLYLRSTIEIHGINNQVEAVEEEESATGNSSVEPEGILARGADDSFEFEVKNEDESSSSIESSPDPLPHLTEDKEESEQESDRWKYKQQTQSFEEFFNKDKEPESELDVEELPESSSYVEDNEDLSPYESDESRAGTADLTYLSDMFRGGNEQYTKLKLCIVQEKDTLESIAEKYQTSTLQIRSQNRIEADDLTEGQILYIPVKS